MQVKAISDTIQEFCGIRYYRCGHYFQRDGERLHRVVWETVNRQSIPDGWHVHHIDHDKTNNQPDNLTILPQSEHQAHHGSERTDFPPEARDAAREWHKSDEGRRWHAEHYQRVKHRLHQKRPAICAHCYSEFKTVGGSYCSNACKSAARRASGVDDEKRTCEACGGAFTANRYSKSRACSRKCAGALQSRTKRRA
jgi:hypothetical protein